jgi:hypothetical protein
MRPKFLCILTLFVLAGCGGGSSGSECTSSQALTLSGYSTGSTPVSLGLPRDPSPYPAAATFLYFSAEGGAVQTDPAHPPTVTGVPILAGSDGTTIEGGTLVPSEYTHLSITNLLGYSSSISGLAANVTYKVSFASLQSVQTGCRYGSQSSGEFSAN